MQRIYALQNWTTPQRQWLKRIEKQLRAEIVVDREYLDSAAFKNDGGFNRLNKIFDGRLEALLGQINEELWTDAA